MPNQFLCYYKFRDINLEYFHCIIHCPQAHKSFIPKVWSNYITVDIESSLYCRLAVTQCKQKFEYTPKTLKVFLVLEVCIEKYQPFVYNFGIQAHCLLY